MFVRLLITFLVLALFSAFTLFVAYNRIAKTGASSIHPDLETLPVFDVAIVLGTSPRISKNTPNPFFENRINAAARLYHARKVRHLLLSGDNGTRYYNEVAAMKNALLRRGVPESAITLDHAGFSTLDSIVRAKKIFGLDSFLIVTQRDHALRALYIARHCHLDALAFPAPDVPPRFALRTNIRESLARVRTILDLHLLNRTPRFLGPFEPIIVPTTANIP